MIGRRRKFRQNWQNKVQWPIHDRQLDDCPYQSKFESIISKEQLKEFRDHINSKITVTFSTIAPLKLQWGGQVIALLVMILGAVCVSDQPNELDDVVGSALLLLGFFIAFLAFWYRGQLIKRSWKKVGQYLHEYFKEFGHNTPGVSYEFHVQGHHSRKHFTKRGLGKEERSTVWYERYIVIYLPGDQGHYHDFREDDRTVNQIIAADSQAVDTNMPIINDAHITLPYWWSVAHDRNGKQYYINNLKHRTQWNPPTQDQLETEAQELEEVLAPPGTNMDDYSEDHEV